MRHHRIVFKRSQSVKILLSTTHWLLLLVRTYRRKIGNFILVRIRNLKQGIGLRVSSVRIKGILRLRSQTLIRRSILITRSARRRKWGTIPVCVPPRSLIRRREIARTLRIVSMAMRVMMHMPSSMSTGLTKSLRSVAISILCARGSLIRKIYTGSPISVTISLASVPNSLLFLMVPISTTLISVFRLTGFDISITIKITVIS